MGKKNKKGNNSPNAVTLESSSPAHQMTGDSMRELEQAECNVPLISKDNPLIHEEPSAPPTPPTPPKVGELHPSGLEEADTGAPVSQFAPLQAPAPSRAVPVPSAPPQEGPEEDLPPPPILTVVRMNFMYTRLFIIYQTASLVSFLLSFQKSHVQLKVLIKCILSLSPENLPSTPPSEPPL